MTDANPPASTAPDAEESQCQLPRHVAVIMDGNNRWAKQSPTAHREAETAKAHRG